MGNITSPNNFSVQTLFLEDVPVFINSMYKGKERVSCEVPTYFDMNSPYIQPPLFSLVTELVLCYYRTVPEPKNILIFLPGIKEIARQAESIRESIQSLGSRSILVIELHRQTAPEQ